MPAAALPWRWPPAHFDRSGGVSGIVGTWPVLLLLVAGLSLWSSILVDWRTRVDRLT
jgi:hypothetical protein